MEGNALGGPSGVEHCDQSLVSSHKESLLCTMEDQANKHPPIPLYRTAWWQDLRMPNAIKGLALEATGARYCSSEVNCVGLPCGDIQDGLLPA